MTKPGGEVDEDRIRRSLTSIISALTLFFLIPVSSAQQGAVVSILRAYRASTDQSFSIPDGTPVSLRLAEPVRGMTRTFVRVKVYSRKGDKLRLVASDDVRLNGMVVIAMVASLGAGAIVMLTKSKSHWLYIDFHEQSAPKSVVLRMDKNEYQKIFQALKAHTGKEVEFLGDAKDKQKKEDKPKNN